MDVKGTGDRLPFCQRPQLLVESNSQNVCKNVNKHSYPLILIIYLILYKARVSKTTSFPSHPPISLLTASKQFRGKGYQRGLTVQV